MSLNFALNEKIQEEEDLIFYSLQLKIRIGPNPTTPDPNPTNADPNPTNQDPDPTNTNLDPGSPHLEPAK